MLFELTGVDPGFYEWGGGGVVNTRREGQSNLTTQVCFQVLIFILKVKLFAISAINNGYLQWCVVNK